MRKYRIYTRFVTGSLWPCLLTAAVEGRPDIEYGRGLREALTLDAHIPEGPGPFAGAILVHRGGWNVGDKQGEFIRPLFQPLDESGPAWFSINYRLAPKHPYPAAVRDAEEAIRYVKKSKADQNTLVKREYRAHWSTPKGV